MSLLSRCGVMRRVAEPLIQGQYDALLSFTRNEGAGRLQTSTRLKNFNTKNYARRCRGNWRSGCTAVESSYRGR